MHRLFPPIISFIKAFESEYLYLKDKCFFIPSIKINSDKMQKADK